MANKKHVSKIKLLDFGYAKKHNNKINKKTTYNNITDKFELESYEKTIIENLASEISDNIMLTISKISE